MKKARQLIDIELAVEDFVTGSDSQFKRALNIGKLQLSVIERILATQTRVDETQLRRRQFDVLPRLLAMLQEEKKAMGITIEG